MTDYWWVFFFFLIQTFVILTALRVLCDSCSYCDFLFIKFFFKQQDDRMFHIFKLIQLVVNTQVFSHFSCIVRLSSFKGKTRANRYRHFINQLKVIMCLVRSFTFQIIIPVIVILFFLLVRFRKTFLCPILCQIRLNLTQLYCRW